MPGLEPRPTWDEQLARTLGAGTMRSLSGFGHDVSPVLSKSRIEAGQRGKASSAASVKGRKHKRDLLKAAGAAPATTYTLTYNPADPPNWPSVYVNGLNQADQLWSIVGNTLTLDASFDLQAGDVLWVEYDYLSAVPSAPAPIISSFLFVNLYRGGTNAVILTKNVGGTDTVLSQVLPTIAAGDHVLRAEATGGAITVKLDGATVLTYTLSSADQTSFGGNTGTGLRAAAGSAQTVTFENLTVGGTVLDTFNRANAGSLGSSSTGKAWAQSGGSIGIASNRASITQAAGDPTAVAVVDGGISDGAWEVTVGMGLDGGLIFRATT